MNQPLHPELTKMLGNIPVSVDMTRVYIASPYTLGDVSMNVKVQHDAQEELMNLGYMPIMPLLSHYQHIVHPRHYEDWFRLDLEMIKGVDAVLRLPGESSGADREEEFAKERGIPVFYSIEELVLNSPSVIRNKACSDPGITENNG